MPDLKDKLTKSMVTMVIGAIALAFSVFFFFDTRYFHNASANDLEIKLAGALTEQMNTQKALNNKQLKQMDIRQLDQLRCSKALLETELKRDPNNTHIREKLDIMNTQIKDLEKSVYGIQ